MCDKEYVEISDEHILNVLSNDQKLLIIGNSGSGKTRLVNRMLRVLEEQPDTIYLFITHDLVNHTGGNSYGHLSAERLHIDNLEEYVPLGILLDAKLANTIIEFPYDSLPKIHEKHHLLINFVRLFFELCHQENKRLIMVGDDVSVAVSTIIYAMSDDNKCILTEFAIENLKDEFQSIEPNGIQSMSRFQKLYLRK